MQKGKGLYTHTHTHTQTRAPLETTHTCVDTRALTVELEQSYLGVLGARSEQCGLEGRKTMSVEYALYTTHNRSKHM